MIDSLALHLEPFLAWLLRTTWQASLLVGLILLLQKVLGRRFGVRGRHCLWLLVLLRLALPWTLPSRVSVYNLLPSAPLRGYQTSGAPAQRASTPALTLEGYPDPSPELAGSPAFIPLVETSPAQRGQWPGPQAPATILLSLVWLAGAGFLAGCILASTLRWRRVVRRGWPVTDRWILDLLAECQRLLGVRRPRRDRDGQG